MSSFFFVVRVFIFTAALLMFLQIRWEDKTLEAHTLKFVRTSSVAGSIHSAAEGTVRTVLAGWNNLRRALRSGFSEQSPEKEHSNRRRSTFRWQHAKSNLEQGTTGSMEFIKESTEDTRQMVKESIQRLVGEDQSASSSFFDDKSEE